MDKEPTKELSLSTSDIRRVWHNNTWYYVIVDVLAYVLPEAKDHANYWRVLKNRLRNEEGARETIEGIVQLKLKARDGRMRQTDTCDRVSVFRILQSIHSPWVEPFKQWLAVTGDERIEEIEHPEQAIERIRADLRAKGYDEKWIEERIKSDLIRNDLTDEWKERGAEEGVQFAILTNEIHQGTFDISIQAHKKYKVLPAKANLRDHMTHLELALTSLSEATAITLHQNRDSQGFPELRRDATDAGTIGGEARRLIEQRIDQPIVSAQNHLGQSARKKRQHLTQSDANQQQEEENRQEPGEPEQRRLF